MTEPAREDLRGIVSRGRTLLMAMEGTLLGEPRHDDASAWSFAICEGDVSDVRALVEALSKIAEQETGWLGRLNKWGELPEDAPEVMCHCRHHAQAHGWWRKGEATPCMEDGCNCGYFRPMDYPPGSYPLAIVPLHPGLRDG